MRSISTSASTESTDISISYWYHDIYCALGVSPAWRLRRLRLGAWKFPGQDHWVIGGHTVPIRRRVSSCRSSSVQFKASNCHPACRVLRSSSRFTRTCLLKGELKGFQDWCLDHLWKGQISRISPRCCRKAIILGKSSHISSIWVAKRLPWVKAKMKQMWFEIPKISHCQSQRNFAIQCRTRAWHPSWSLMSFTCQAKTCG